jgi:hypothetical protein
MGKEEDIKTRISQTIINRARDAHKETIDKAYEYFWDENKPDEFLTGTALELGFHNFEDWFIYDYKANELGETFLDLYAKANESLGAEEEAVISKMRESVLSLYEVESVSKDKRVLIKDILLEGEFSLRDKALTRGLTKGDLFAARILELDGKHLMSSAVYPFPKNRRKKVLDYVEKQFARYKRHINSDGGMRDYLKQYGDVFNLIWIELIAASGRQEEQ